MKLMAGGGRPQLIAGVSQTTMNFDHITYLAPPADDDEIFMALPRSVGGLLRELNGFILFGGGLHVRGASHGPDWHSLRSAWRGEDAFHSLYSVVEATDVPVAEDCVGDQFLLRGEVIWRLSCETGELETLGVSFIDFLELAQADPVEYLQMHPLLEYLKGGEPLIPGQLLSVYPPFCTKEAGDGVALNATSAMERRRFLADFSAQIGGVAEGGEVVIEVVDSEAEAG